MRPKMFSESELTARTKADIEIARKQIRKGRGISTKKLIVELGVYSIRKRNKKK